MYEKVYDGDFRMYAKREKNEIKTLFKWIMVYAVLLAVLLLVDMAWHDKTKPLVMAVLSLFTGSHLMKIA